MVVPSSTSTSPSITVYGPTVTSPASFAFGSTTAVGWIVAMDSKILGSADVRRSNADRPRQGKEGFRAHCHDGNAVRERIHLIHWRGSALDRRTSALSRLSPRITARELAQRAEELGLADDGVADLRDGVELADAAALAAQRVARDHRLLEARAVDAHEVVDPAPVVLVSEALEGEHRRGLRHRLHDEDAGHHRVVREVPREERLVHRHVLDRDEALVLLVLDHAVDQQERVAVREILLDLLNGHRLAHGPLPEGRAARARRCDRAGAGAPRSSAIARAASSAGPKCTSPAA